MMLILCVTIFLPTTVSTGLQGMPCQLESQVHSTNTLIDEVGLVEMEVGLDQLTWGDADLQRELRRLEGQQFENSEPEIYFQNCLIKSDPHPDTLFWHSFWHIIWTYMWHICSDILSYILFWDSIWHSFWHPIWHLFWHTFWNILYSDPALPWVWAGSAFICADQCQWLEYPPNVGFTCLHPMIAITIDTPKWPGPEFESRSWKVFWVLKKQDFGTGSEKRRRWKIQVCCWVAKLG